MLRPAPACPSPSISSIFVLPPYVGYDAQKLQHNLRNASDCRNHRRKITHAFCPNFRVQKPHHKGPVDVASFTKGRFVAIAPSVGIEAQTFQMRLRNARASRYNRRKNAPAFGLIFHDASRQVDCMSRTVSKSSPQKRGTYSTYMT